MAELYSNQIKPSGVSQPRASAPQFSNAIGEALNNLGARMERFAAEKAASEDAQLRIRVANKAKEAQIMLQDADVDGFNYEEQVTQANAIYMSAFEGFNEAAVNRFYRDHPDADVLFGMEMDSIALNKSREQNYKNFSNELDSMASQVALGVENEKFYADQIDSTQMTVLQKNALKDGLSKSVVEYKIAAHLSYGTPKELKKASAIVEDTKNKLSPEERVLWAQRIQVAHERNQKAAASKAQQREQDIEDAVLEQYLQLAHKQGWGVANQFRTELEQLDGEVVIGGVAINTSDPKSPNYVSQTTIHSVLKNIKEKTAETTSSIAYEVTQERRANQILAYYEDFKKNGHKEGMLEASQQSMQLLNSKVFNTFDKKTQNKIVELAYAPTDTIMESVGGLNKNAYLMSGEHRPTFAGIGVPWTQSTPLPVKRVYDAVTSESSNINDVESALYYQRNILDDRLLNGELAIEPGSNAAVLTDAYLQLDAISRNPLKMVEFGYKNVSPSKLAQAYTNALYNFKASGIYNQEFDQNTDFAQTLLDSVIGAQKLPQNEESSVRLDGIEVNAKSIAGRYNVNATDSKGKINLRTTNLLYPNTVGKKTGFGK